MNSSLRGTPARPRGFGFLRHPSMDTTNASVESKDDGYSTPEQRSGNTDLLSVFQKKNTRSTIDSQDRSVTTECTYDISLSDSPLSQAASSRSTSPASSSSTSPLQSRQSPDVWQWHSTLVAQEAARKTTVATHLASHQARYTALHELVSNTAVAETKAACQWTTGLSKAQTQLASAFAGLSLVAPAHLAPPTPSSGTSSTRETRTNATTHSKDGTDDLDQRYLSVARRVTDESSLPEKPIRLGFDVDDVNSEGTTKGGDGSEDHYASALPSSSSPSLQNNVAGPPVAMIAFPNPQTPHETLGMLHKQHVLLSETLVRQTISNAALDKVQLLKELSHENATTLEQVAGAILTDLSTQEAHIQKLWDVYHTAAESMLSAATPKTDAATALDASTRKKSHAAAAATLSLGDVWVAEVAYRQAVAEQASTWATQWQTLQSMFEVAKEGECQRRAKLRRHLLVSVIQKHTQAFHHAQQLHTDALEDCMRYYCGSDGRDKKGRKIKPSPQRTWTTRERIEHMAHQSGSTIVWDDGVITEELKSSPNVNEALDEGIVEKGNVVDVDDFMDFSSDEEDDLPLLAQAEDLKERPQAAVGAPPKVKKVRSSSKGRSKSKDAKKKSKKQLPNKANRIIMLDQDSPHESFFMDRLLYSGSLLESHYVQFAAVAKVEDERPTADATQELASDEPPSPDETPVSKTSLVIITEDDILHLFDIDSGTASAEVIDASPTFGSNATPKGIVPGAPPANALQYLLKRLETTDLSLKQQQEPTVEQEGPVTPSKMSFLRSTTSGGTPVKEAKKTKCFEFHNLTASFSVPVSECTFRFFKRGEHAVKIGPKNLQAIPYYGKLSFTTARDQQAFVEASVPKG